MADLIDRREKHWVKGLYRRVRSYRYRRMVDGKMFIEVFGNIPFDEAQRRATRLNLDMDEGKDVRHDSQRAKVTFSAHAEDWLRNTTVGRPALTNTPLVVYRILRRIREGVFKPRDLRVFWIGETEIQGVHPTGDGEFEAELEGGFFEAAFDEYVGSIMQKDAG